MFGLISGIASLFSPRPAPPPSVPANQLNSHSGHVSLSVGPNGSFHFGHCHQPPSCRPQPPCNGALPQPAKKQGFFSKLFSGIGNAISSIFKPITNVISGIGNFFSNLNPFKGLF